MFRLDGFGRLGDDSEDAHQNTSNLTVILERYKVLYGAINLKYKQVRKIVKCVLLAHDGRFAPRSNA